MTSAPKPADLPADLLSQGGCQCGHLRYGLTGRPHAIYICHCRECQRQSASAFGISVIVDSADLHLIQGRPGRWSRPTDSGKQLDCFFCPRCGTRLWHGDTTTAATVSVKGGSLDQPPDLTHAIHIWTRRMLPGVILPAGAVQYDGEPPEQG